MQRLLVGSLCAAVVGAAFSFFGTGTQAQDCAATPWRCPPAPAPAPPRPAGEPTVEGVAVGPDFFDTPLHFVDGGRQPDGSRRIYAIGDIGPDSDRAFREYVTYHDAPFGTVIVFNSPGGNPDAGMGIGRAIRELSFKTSIGRMGSGVVVPGLRASDQPGVCASACSLAFLGGVERDVTPGSLYGVHAARVDGPGPNDVNLLFAGQQLAVRMADYLRSMDVDPNLLTVLSHFDSARGETFFVPPELMADLRVTTTLTTRWSMTSSASGYSLVGMNPVSTAVPGESDWIAFTCLGSPRRVVFTANVMPEALVPAVGRTTPQLLALETKGYSLTGLDTKSADYVTLRFAPAQVERPAHMVDSNHAAATVLVTPAVVDLLKRANLVRFTFERPASPNATIPFDMGSGRQQALNFIAGCK